jgi:hypothetical protein
MRFPPLFNYTDIKRWFHMNEHNMHHYVPLHFRVEEFVDPETFKNRGNRSLALIDWRMLWTADHLREYFDKPITINNWIFGGNREWSGIRNPKSTYYSVTSQHTMGRALDMLIDGIDADDVRNEIINNPDEPSFKYITTLETDISWVHLDCRILGPDQKRFLLVTP